MLIDSNIIIYSAQQQQESLRRFIAENVPVVSAASIVEVLGYQLLGDEDREAFEEFFDTVTVLPLDDVVVWEAVRLRQLRKLTLGDALIAATALVSDRTLVTRNVQDFDWIPGLRVLNPIDL